MSCQICNKELNKGKNFCSRSCQMIHRNKINPQKRKDSKPCIECQKLTTNPKFCSSICNANYHNIKKEYFCKSCNISLGFGWNNKRKYCKSCVITPGINKNYVDWSKVTLQSIFDKLPKFQANARIRAMSRLNFRKQSPNTKSCQICGYSKFIEICHIKPLKDFNKDTSIAEVNHHTNLIGLCPNCHWELDHGLLKI